MLERINLVPKEASLKRVWPVLYGSLAVFFLLSCCTLYLWRYVTVNKILETEAAILAANQSQASNSQLQQQVQQITAAIDGRKKVVHDLMRETAKLEGIRNKKFQYSKVLRAVAAELPESVKCGSISIEKGKGAITGVAMAYGDLPGLVERLRGHAMFVSVSLQDIDQIRPPQPPASYSFKILFELKPGATVAAGEGNG